MESITEIVNAVSTVGFPIVATFGIGWLLYREQQAHKEETNSLKEAINGNTIVMTELKQLLEDERRNRNV